MASRRGISDSDSALFRNALIGVRELPASGRVHDLHRQPPARPRPQPAQLAAGEHSMPDGVLEDAPGFGERQEFRRASVAQRVWRQLRRGKIPIDDELDLHGFRVDDARLALARFLGECTHRQYRCVRLITGKGFGSRGATPVLKAQVDRWLRLRGEVLAFCSTIARDGGTGAVYVLLRHAPHRR
jgi:DNA-nicking Smr family endonuclease